MSNQPTQETHIIRVHTATEKDGRRVVYARYMEPMVLPGQDETSYLVCGGADVPGGLTQQGAVDYFRLMGWAVQQDHGTDFDNPVWGP